MTRARQGSSSTLSSAISEMLLKPITGPAEFGARMSGRRYDVWKRKKLNLIKAAHGGKLPKKWRSNNEQ